MFLPIDFTHGLNRYQQRFICKHKDALICQTVEGQPQICMDAYVNASGVTCNWRENSFYTTTFSFSLPFSALTKLYSFYIETFLAPNMPDYLLYKLTQPGP